MHNTAARAWQAAFERISEGRRCAEKVESNDCLDLANLTRATATKLPSWPHSGAGESAGPPALESPVELLQSAAQRSFHGPLESNPNLPIQLQVIIIYVILLWLIL